MTTHITPQLAIIRAPPVISPSRLHCLLCGDVLQPRRVGALWEQRRRVAQLRGLLIGKCRTDDCRLIKGPAKE